MPLVQTDYGLIYNDNGTLCATLRPGEGRFGGAVAVEEGTTNQIFVAGYQSWLANLNVGDSTDRSAGGGTIRVTRLGEHRYRAEVIADCTYPILSLTNSFTWPANQPHTISAYILDYYEAPGTTGRLALGRSSSGSPHLHGAAGLGRKTHTYQNTSNINAALAVRAGNHLIKAGTYIEWEFAQVELNKPFATSFVDGTRAAGVLTYDASIMPVQSATVAAWVWVPPSSHWPTTTNWRRIISNANSSAAGIIALYFLPADRKLYLEISDDSRTRQTISSPSSVAEGWHHVAATWDASRMAVYVDGSLVAQQTNPSLPTSHPNSWIAIGSRTDNRDHLNGLIDELLILPYAASEEEIQGWYNNGISFRHQPGYYALFDDSIALQTWTKARYDYEVQNNRIIFERAPKQEDHILASYETPV